MNFYEKSIQKELKKWHKDMKRPPTFLNRFSKSIQSKTQALIPKKMQYTLTAAIKKMTEAIMLGSGLVTHTDITEKMSLAESDFSVEKVYKMYNKTAIAQGVVFGAGGIILGIADFPALLSIKVKFLFDCAKFYGYEVNEKSERLYLLYVFQLAFSSDEHRLKVYNILMNWNPENIKMNELDWEKFQTEYRDYIDLAKLFQLLPVVGAIAGGVANFQLLEKLKITAMNCYRSRHLNMNNCEALQNSTKKF